MTTRAMRRQSILASLRQSGKVDVAELSESLGVAEMTIRRDLDFFSAEGVITRVRGGAVALGSSFDPPFSVRTQESARQKSNIGREVAAQINDGATIVLDGGTTGLAVAEHLFSRVLTVIPLSLRIATYLALSPSIRLYVPGGEVRQGDQSFIGAETLNYLQAHRFDQFVMTSCGMTPHGGFSDWSPEEGAAKKMAIESSGSVIAAVDASKYGHEGFAMVCPIARASITVTDDRLPMEAFDALQGAGTRVLRASDA